MLPPVGRGSAVQQQPQQQPPPPAARQPAPQRRPRAASASSVRSLRLSVAAATSSSSSTASTWQGVSLSACRHLTPAAAAAAKSAAASRAAADPAASLHPLRQREAMELHAEWRRQRSEGLCRIETFAHLLRLKCPGEPRERLGTMAAMATAVERVEAAAEAERLSREADLAALFDALDTDSRGTIDLGEFLQLSRSTGLSKARLCAIFEQRDADRSGALDKAEFRRLVEESEMLRAHKEAIVTLGRTLKEDFVIEERANGPLWKLTGLMPSVPRARLVPLGSKRPSLANIVCATFDVRVAAERCGVGLPHPPPRWEDEMDVD